MDSSIGPFGPGWSLNYAKKSYTKDDGGIRVVELPEGTTEYFLYDGNGGWDGINTQSKLKRIGTTLTLTTKDRVIYTYDTSHGEISYLVEIKDSNNNVISIELNATNYYPAVITDSSDRRYEIDYTNNLISSITDPAGRTVTYTYDLAGRLVQNKSVGNAVVNKFVYTNGLLTAVTDAFDKIQSSVTYDEQGRISKLSDAVGKEETYTYSVSIKGETTVSMVESAGGEPKVNAYNSFGQVILDDSGVMYSYNYDGTVSSIDATNTDKNIVDYSYDDNGNVRKIETRDKDGKILSTEEIINFYFANTSNLSNVQSSVYTHIYDDEGNQTNVEKTQSITTYDENENILIQNDIDKENVGKTTAYTYYANGNLKSETAPDGMVTEHTYDAYGNETNVKVTASDSQTVTSEIISSHNIIGWVISKTEKGLTVTTAYDLAGNIIRQTVTDGSMARTSRTVYDEFGRALHKIADHQYNAQSDLLEPDSNGICLTNVYSDQTVGEKFTYDNAGNVLTYINQAGNKTVNFYNSDKKLVKTVTYETALDAANGTGGLTTRYVYDSQGNLIHTVYPHQYIAALDNLDLEYPYGDTLTGDRNTFDENGNITKQIDSQGRETINTYDSQNRVVKSITDGKVTRFVYDGEENVKQIIHPDQYNSADDNLDIHAETPVDKYSNANVGDRYTYNSENNVLTHTNPEGKVTTNIYNEDGKLTKTTKPDGTVFIYNALTGDVLSESYSDGLKNTVTITDAQTVVSGSNGLTTTWNKNSFGEVTEYKLENGTLNKNYSYTYDASGNIKTISLNGTLQQTFTYSLSNELVRIDDAAADQTTVYTYDYVGNMTEIKTYAYTTGALGVALTTQNYSYDSQNRRSDLSFDASGNMIALGGYGFTWTNGRLESAVSTENNISYTYNYDGIRTSKTVNGVTTNYKTDEFNNIISQDDGTNVLKFVYDSGNAPVYLVWNGTAYYFEKNLQGDVVGLLDEQGNSVVQYSYDVWGKLLSITGDLADTLGVINAIRYRGYYYDTEIGLYYLQSRYYSPELMRFISQDSPYHSNGQGQPLGSNLYAYCLGNPVMFFHRPTLA